MREKKLSIEDQLNDLINKGIVVPDVNYARNYLKEHLNYYRLCSYLKLYEYCHNPVSYIKGTTIDQLIELSRLDLRLRRIILQMTIDIEFASKLELNFDCSENNNDDGYSIVSNFLNDKHQQYLLSDLKKKYNQGNSEYGRGILVSHYPDLATWHLVEILSFGAFIDFWKFYYQYYPKRNLNMVWRNNVLFATKKLRNACAHNNFILSYLRKKPNQINRQLHNTIAVKMSASGNSLTAAEKKEIKESILLCDLIAMFLLYKEVVKSNSLLKNATNQLHGFVNSINAVSKSFLSNNPSIISKMNLIEKIIVVLFPLA